MTPTDRAAHRTLHVTTLLLALVALGVAAACRGESNQFIDARVVNIDQRDDGCTPTSFSIEAGETVRLDVRNHTSVDYFLGVEDLLPLTVPPGQAKTTFYIDPDDRDPDPLRCYIDGGVSTTIEVIR